MYYKRAIEGVIESASKSFKSILVTGARQVGKSTVLKHMFDTDEYITFDDIIIRDETIREPGLFFRNHNNPIILDEVQCGMGRTGAMYAYQHYGIKPDIMTAAKALGNGVPVGAFAVTNAVAESSLIPGDHGTTYGGNPLCTAAVSQVFDMFEEYKLVDHVNKISPYFEQVLDIFVNKYDFITARRGHGLMQGLVLTIPVKEVVTKALLEQQLVVLSAGSDVLRLLPPLVITEQDIDEFKEKIEKVFDTFL